MPACADNHYPGGAATAAQVLELADEYRRGAAALLPSGRPGRPLSRLPHRLLAIQAIELYLNAYLLARGHPPATVRGLQHGLEMRGALAAAAGLRLRARTAAHLAALDAGREYLVSRYAPERAGETSQLNRLVATLEEVARKTAAPPTWAEPA